MTESLVSHWKHSQDLRTLLPFQFTPYDLVCVFPHLSEDEAGGRGAAIRPLESAPPGISPSIHLDGNVKMFL